MQCGSRHSHLHVESHRCDAVTRKGCEGNSKLFHVYEKNLGDVHVSICHVITDLCDLSRLYETRLAA